MRWFKTMLISGAVFLLPLLLLWLLASKAFQLAVHILYPIERVLPAWRIAGVEMPHLIAALVLLAICVLAGMLVHTPRGQHWRARIEEQTLGKIPGYSLLRTLFTGAAPTEKPVEVVLVEMENMRVIAFVMERTADGRVTLFVPSAPTPAVGSVFFARAEQVQTIDMSLKDAMLCISRLGVGAEKLLTRSSNAVAPRC